MTAEGPDTRGHERVRDECGVRGVCIRVLTSVRDHSVEPEDRTQGRDAARKRVEGAGASEAAGGSTEPAAEEATDVEAVSAADVLAGVEESGPNYALPAAREGQRERRERLRVDETAKQAGHTIVETGTHVEILGEQGLWWPATIAGREEDVDGRLVHEVEYDGYQGEQYCLHILHETRNSNQRLHFCSEPRSSGAPTRPPARPRSGTHGACYACMLLHGPSRVTRTGALMCTKRATQANTRGEQKGKSRLS